MSYNLRFPALDDTVPPLPKILADSTEKMMRMFCSRWWMICREGSSGYQQWVDRSYLAIDTPSIDWDAWFEAIGFPTAGVEETGEEEEVDEAGQPYGIPRLIMAQGDYMVTVEDILSCKGTDGLEIEQEQCWARIRSYMRFKVFQYYSNYLDNAYQEALQKW